MRLVFSRRLNLAGDLIAYCLTFMFYFPARRIKVIYKYLRVEELGVETPVSGFRYELPNPYPADAQYNSKLFALNLYLFARWPVFF